MTSRPFSGGERQFIASKDIDVVLTDLALDGVTVIVNHGNPITALDFTQLRDIFTGRVRNWLELGGIDAEIAPFGRATGSGTAALFNERILSGSAAGPLVQHLPTNETIVTAVTATPGALGYIGFGALRGGNVKAVSLRIDDKTAPIAPSIKTIRSGTYPLARALHLATPSRPVGAVKAFLDFCSGGRGQVLIQRAGYVAIAPASP
jgi:phosphate transport system substrate-binding protein